MDIASLIQTAVGTDIFAGGLVLGALGSLVALCRTLPGRLARIIRRQFVVTIEIRDTDPAFEWVGSYLAQHQSMRGARTLTVTSRAARSTDPQPISSAPKKDAPHISLTPAPGVYLLWEGRRPVLLIRERKDGGDGPGALFPPRDTYRLSCFGRRSDLLRRILEDATALAHKPEARRVGIWSLTYESWRIVTHMRARTLQSVHLAAGQLERISADLDQFLAAEEWYTERGLRWKRGHLYEGPPGSGKTSLAGALAGHYKMDLYLCSVSDKGMTDERLTRGLLEVNERSIVLIEDIDCVVKGREVQGDGGVTFAGLLNAIDGVASKPGVVFILTTNHPEALDPALLRAGRVDLREHLGPAQADQAARLYAHFYGGRPELTELAEHFGRRGVGQAMATLQGVLLAHRDDPAGALKACEGLRHPSDTPAAAVP
jgi:mitochondrial chaperone BCS1